MTEFTSMSIKKTAAMKLRAVERALGLTRSNLIEALLYMTDLVDMDVEVKDVEGIGILTEHFKTLKETGRANPTVKAMIRNNLKD